MTASYLDASAYKPHAPYSASDAIAANIHDLVAFLRGRFRGRQVRNSYPVTEQRLSLASNALDLRGKGNVSLWVTRYAAYREEAVKNDAACEAWLSPGELEHALRAERDQAENELARMHSPEMRQLEKKAVNMYMRTGSTKLLDEYRTKVKGRESHYIPDAHGNLKLVENSAKEETAATDNAGSDRAVLHANSVQKWLREKPLDVVWIKDDDGRDKPVHRVPEKNPQLSPSEEKRLFRLLASQKLVLIKGESGELTWFHANETQLDGLSEFERQQFEIARDTCYAIRIELACEECEIAVKALLDEYTECKDFEPRQNFSDWHSNFKLVKQSKLDKIHAEVNEYWRLLGKETSATFHEALPHRVLPAGQRAINTVVNTLNIEHVILQDQKISNFEKKLRYRIVRLKNLVSDFSESTKRKAVVDSSLSTAAIYRGRAKIEAMMQEGRVYIDAINGFLSQETPSPLEIKLLKLKQKLEANLDAASKVCYSDVCTQAEIYRVRATLKLKTEMSNASANKTTLREAIDEYGRKCGHVGFHSTDLTEEEQLLWTSALARYRALEAGPARSA